MLQLANVAQPGHQDQRRPGLGLFSQCGALQRMVGLGDGFAVDPVAAVVKQGLDLGQGAV
ncbi:MAG: hypothetical protein ACK57J_07135 [Rubrivivax sp.]